jgi:hypothetical protein
VLWELPCWARTPVELGRPNPVGWRGLAGEPAPWGAVAKGGPGSEGAIREVVGLGGSPQWWPLPRLNRLLGLLGRWFRFEMPAPAEQLVFCVMSGWLGLPVVREGQGLRVWQGIVWPGLHELLGARRCFGRRAVSGSTREGGTGSMAGDCSCGFGR